jgi:hypothetical protein
VHAEKSNNFDDSVFFFPYSWSSSLRGAGFHYLSLKTSCPGRSARFYPGAINKQPPLYGRGWIDIIISVVHLRVTQRNLRR